MNLDFFGGESHELTECKDLVLSMLLSQVVDRSLLGILRTFRADNIGKPTACCSSHYTENVCLGIQAILSLCEFMAKSKCYPFFSSPVTPKDL